VAAVAVLAASATALGVGVGTASAKSGGDAHFNQKGTFDYTDPALGYLQVFWQITQATCVKLVNYPDTTGAAALQLKPEAASAFAITNGGKTYTFTVPANKYKFYPKGGGVTAATFKAVVERLADPKMNMPAPAYLSEIVGAQARIDGKASSVSPSRCRATRSSSTSSRRRATSCRASRCRSSAPCRPTRRTTRTA